MRKFILAALLCAAGSSFANTMLARDGNDWVRVTNKPCTNELVLSQIQPSAADQFMAATAMVANAPYAACWTPYGDGALLIYEDGDKGIVPFSAFKEDLGI